MAAGALAGLVILVIGDSHMVGVGGLINALHKPLEDAGAAVHSYGMCAATPQDWLTRSLLPCGRGRHDEHGPALVELDQRGYGWTVDELIAKHHPNLVIVEIGDAMGGYGQGALPKAWIYQQTRALAGRIAAANISCVWVGPVYGDPNSPYRKTNDRVSDLSQLLAQSVAPCRYIDSLSFERAAPWPTSDGEHLTPPGYRSWGKDIAEAVSQMKVQGVLNAR